MARSWPYLVLLLPRCSGPVISSLGEHFRPISAPSPCLYRWLLALVLLLPVTFQTVRVELQLS